MLTIIMGKAGSGKDCVINELKKVGFKQIVAYTTRPKRDSERDGREYYYITDEEFAIKRKNGFFAEARVYYVGGKKWWYGSPLVEMLDATVNNEDYVIILTPTAISTISTLKNISPNGVTVIYLYANQKTILKRLKKRKDKDDSMQRRMNADNLDFKDATTLADYIVYNNDGDDITKVANKIIKYVSQD